MKVKKKTKLYEWQVKGRTGGLCEKCGEQKEVLTVDHRIPQSLLTQLGFMEEIYEWEENYWMLCNRCNAFKGNRIDVTDKKSRELLNEIVNKL